MTKDQNKKDKPAPPPSKKARAPPHSREQEKRVKEAIVHSVKDVRKKSGTKGQSLIETAASIVRQEDAAAVRSKVSRLLTYNNGDNQVELTLQINPPILFQYITGLLGRVMSTADDQVLTRTVAQAVYSIANYFPQVETCPYAELPRGIVELMRALETKSAGKFRYVADWNPLRLVLNSIGASGLTEGIVGFNWNLFTRTQSTASDSTIGFYTSLIGQGLQILTPAAMKEFLGQYANLLDLVPVGQVSWPTDDASAFAFDESGPILAYKVASNSTQQNVSSWGATEIGFVVGYDKNTQSTTPDYNKLYLKQSSAVGLESPIKTKWLARLRLATTVKNATYVVNPSSTQNSDAPVPQVRRAHHTITVDMTPGAIGWSNCTKKTRVQFPVQLKLIPARSVIQDIIYRLEQAINNCGATIKNAWLSDFNRYDIEYIAYLMFRFQFNQYAGCEVGAKVPYLDVGGSSPSVATPSPGSVASYCHHIDQEMMSFLRYIEPIGVLLGAQLSTYDNAGTLIPVYMDSVVPWMCNHLSGFTYTGAGILGTNNSSSSTPPWVNSQQLNFNGNLLALLFKFKAYDANFASVARMVTRDLFGDSLLHTTLYQGSAGSLANQNLIGASSRVPFTQKQIFAMFRALCAVGYDYATFLNAYSSSEIDYTATNFSIYSKEYEQRYSRTFSSVNTIDSYAQMFRFDDMVIPGTEITNIVDVGDIEYEERNSNAKFAKQHASDSPSYIEKALKAGVPQYGNYCGPGWTAGTRDGTILGTDGKYHVPPVDALDAVCKRHDEAYAKAAGSNYLRDIADGEMLRELRGMGFSEKGIYGLSAEALFASLKHFRGGSSAPPALASPVVRKA